MSVSVSRAIDKYPDNINAYPDNWLDLYTFGQVISMASLRFGQHLITSSQIFFQSSLSFAFVNIRPVVLGRILDFEIET